MNRSDLHKLANARLREAQALFAAGETSGAYYLAGYAVECGLKACFARQVRRYDFPDKTAAGKIFTHRLTEIARLSQLTDALNAEIHLSTAFSLNWSLVCTWSEESRYSFWSESDAEAMLGAIMSRKDGVLPWIKRRW